MIDGYEVFRLYEAVKLHFTSNYDFFKYYGKIKANKTSFLGRKDKIFFDILAKKFSDGQALQDFLVANFVVNEKIWIRELLDPECMKEYSRFKGRLESLTYRFKSDVENLFQYCADNNLSPNDLFKVKDGEALLWKLYRRNECSKETMILLDWILKFMDTWDEKLSDTILWPKTHKHMVKYRAFILQVCPDVSGMKKILREAVKNQLTDAI